MSCLIGILTKKGANRAGIMRHPVARCKLSFLGDFVVGWCSEPAAKDLHEGGLLLKTHMNMIYTYIEYDIQGARDVNLQSLLLAGKFLSDQ